MRHVEYWIADDGEKYKNMKKWHLHINTHKSWYKDKAGNYFWYDIYFLPSINLYYDSVMNCVSDNYRESPRLFIQWLVWSIDIWFDYDNLAER